MLISSLLFLFAALAQAGPTPGPAPSSAPANPNIPARICGTADPSDELKQVHGQLREAARTANLQKRATTFPHTTVETYVHFVTTFDQANKYSPALRQTLASNQAFVLNTAYAPANISFHMQKPSYTINDAWATDSGSTAMKSALRKGGYGALNIYFQTNLSSTSTATTPGQTLLGYCTLPQSVIYQPPCASGTSPCPAPIPYPSSAYAQDGCNVLLGSMPQGGVHGYQMGKTAVHEVGHWFGLLHTFQDNTCTVGDAGDYIEDTRQEATATAGCPQGKNSCPGLKVPGADPISNFMDYSTDEW
jgi:hypothetical protein